MLDHSITYFKKALQDYQSIHDKDRDWQRHPKRIAQSAAVLLSLVKEQGQWSVLFIQRAKNPKDVHSGQVAFPGGRIEKNDADFIETALRETEEEIGIKVSKSSVIGLLPLMLSRKQYQVRPVIASIDWPQKTALQDSEVAELFTLPLAWLADSNNLESASVLGLPENSTIVYKAYQGQRLWGLTAQIVQKFIQVISTK